MAERRTLGQILMASGRIGDNDVARALEYQQEHGGYFGEALVVLGLVSQEELEWGLASQFDLPYVFPEADSIDPQAAALVTPEWALANLALPIMKTGDAVTVIIDSPIKTDPVDELQHRTGLNIELALASPTKIRELIRQVYGRAAAAEETPDGNPAVPLDTLLGEALDVGARQFGVSVRGRRVVGWYSDQGAVRRRHLVAGWADDLDRLLDPPPADMVADGSGTWRGQLERKGIRETVEARVLSSGTGTEYLLKLAPADPASRERFSAPTSGVSAEVRLLARSGTARFVVTTEPPDFCDEILPFLPALLLEHAWRSVHLADAPSHGADEVFTVAMPPDEDARAETLSGLRVFRFDAVTANLTGPPEQWAPAVLDLADVGFVAGDRGGNRSLAEAAGIRWELRIDREPEGRLAWALLPLR